MGKFNAIGPTLIGLAAPVNDLSRGASKDDVIGLSYITGNQVLALKK
jgi:phosphate acetyltransferase